MNTNEMTDDRFSEGTGVLLFGFLVPLRPRKACALFLSPQSDRQRRTEIQGSDTSKISAAVEPIKAGRCQKSAQGGPRI